MSFCLGFDTSNYTTSVAMFDGSRCYMSGRLLDVPAGALGLRQSEAHFAHTKRLPGLIDDLFEKSGRVEISCVAASTRPVEREGSYMPCFLAGESQARVTARALGVPFFGYSHQQGHLAAAAWSAGRQDLLKQRFLAWHLSGGTTELLLAEPDGTCFAAQRIGGTEDLAAGQLIDRTGKLLGTAFPAGPALDTLAQGADKDVFFKAKLRGLDFSLSGLENKVNELYQRHERAENIAFFAVSSVAHTVLAATLEAFRLYGELPLICSGGVARNTTVRKLLTANTPAFFAEPEYSSDNAAGIAILGFGGSV